MAFFGGFRLLKMAFSSPSSSMVDGSDSIDSFANNIDSYTIDTLADSYTIDSCDLPLGIKSLCIDLVRCMQSCTFFRAFDAPVLY